MQEVLKVGEKLAPVTEVYIDQIDDDLDELDAQNADLTKSNLYKMKIQYLEAKIKNLQETSSALGAGAKDIPKAIAYAEERITGLTGLLSRELQSTS